IVQATRVDPFELPKLPYYDVQNIPMGSVERSLVYTTAATSNNELTTNYNVRGGSYDENLVYVNGFNIYRPFLTRSGQQEGMSFINSALVRSIRFSAGGFDAQYGDKLSSVLDIEYKDPSSLKGSVMASLLGVEAHVEHNPTTRFNFLVGARYRANGYLLNSLPAKGAYNPVFWDAQFLTNYMVTENVTWSVIGHFSSNNFRFSPQTQETDFGTANEAYSFKVYFDGQEQTRFQTMMGGTSLKWKVNKKTNLDFYATVFNTVEREYFDIQGQYYINELETDPSKEEYGDSIAVLGIGTFLNHARNRLNATIFNVYHNGKHVYKNSFTNDDRTKFENHAFQWGVNFQHDDFYDVLSEWKMIDSAGYSIPQGSSDQVELFETIKGKLNLTSQRATAFFQFNSIWSNTRKDLLVTVKQRKGFLIRKVIGEVSDTIRESNARWALNAGSRTGFTTANDEFFITPRVSVIYYPRVYMLNKGKVTRRDMSVRLASGMYYQPPFYREFRTFAGQLNLNVKSQKSFHVVGGTDVYFNMWNREVPFKFTAEAYYKYLWDVNPYEIENVRTRYYADNNAVAYAYGMDLNIYGEFVEGIESFFKVGVLSTKEDLKNDSFKEYYNAAGEKIIFGYSEDQIIVDSATIYPGFVPRPTDQLINFGALVQDRMPGFESFSVQMGLQYGAPLPYGPPDLSRYKDTLRIKSYFRVDIGMSYDFLYEKSETKNFWNKNFTDAIISFEVFNLLGINNVLSKQWVQDVEGRYYSIPNYLTQRRFNLKMILRF
ncbi:MAG: TonB-dependent receptor plug domain-containing protein, partial [Flavobacteriales bacterium]